jgi:hypothetical protein
MPDVLRSFQDIEFLRNRLGALRQEFEGRSNNMQDDNCEHEYNVRSRLENTSEGRGRPRVEIAQSQLEALHNAGGFRWNDVARMLQVSSRTLRRRRHELGMRVEGREFSDISDIQLDNVVREVLQSTPSAGLRLVQGSLRQQSLVVQRLRVLHSLRRVDPVASTLRNARQIIRRKYNVKAPNSLWQV